MWYNCKIFYAFHISVNVVQLRKKPIVTFSLFIGIKNSFRKLYVTNFNCDYDYITRHFFSNNYTRLMYNNKFVKRSITTSDIVNEIA